MNKLKDNNYIVIQSFMVKDLHLKGNELLVYAIIYGFSQTEGQCFNGGLSYLTDWTSATKQGVIKNLKSLVEKGLITKKESIINNVKFVEYRATEFNGSANDVEQGVLNIVERGGKHSLPNNKNNNKMVDNKGIIYIVDYLNKKAKTNYRYKAADTQKHIKARLNEGYTVDDFKTVIDKKVNEWSNTDMSKYLRPATLFGSKFESYLNQPENNNKQQIKSTYDIDKIAQDTMFNDDYDI